MHWLNKAEKYGAYTMLLHWAIVLLFAFQFFAADAMLTLKPKTTLYGLDANNYFNYHKSFGLIALGIVVLRLLNRSFGRLPDWAKTLNERERYLTHYNEKILYAAMLIMPVTGYIYVMAGGYGVHFFEVTYLWNPIGRWKSLADITRMIHIYSGYVVVISIAVHLIVVFYHQLLMKDKLLYRMLPMNWKPAEDEAAVDNQSAEMKSTPEPETANS